MAEADTGFDAISQRVQFPPTAPHPKDRAMQTARRRFLQTVAGAASCGLVDQSWLRGLASFGAEPPPDKIQFGPDIEPIVRLIEETPRERCVEVFIDHPRRRGPGEPGLPAAPAGRLRALLPRQPNPRQPGHPAGPRSPAEHVMLLDGVRHTAWDSENIIPPIPIRRGVPVRHTRCERRVDARGDGRGRNSAAAAVASA